VIPERIIFVSRGITVHVETQIKNIQDNFLIFSSKKSYEYPLYVPKILSSHRQTETKIFRLSLWAANGTKTDGLSRNIYS
jgi:hypothetical protein